MSDVNKLMTTIEDHANPETVILEIIANAGSPKIGATNMIINIKWDHEINSYTLQIDHNGRPLLTPQEVDQFFSIGGSGSTGHKTNTDGHHGLGWKYLFLSEQVRIFNVISRNKIEKFIMEECGQKRDNHCLVTEIDTRINTRTLFTSSGRIEDFPFEQGIRFYAQGYFNHREQEINTLFNTDRGYKELVSNIKCSYLTGSSTLRNVLLSIQLATGNERVEEILNSTLNPAFEIDVETPISNKGGVSCFKVRAYDRSKLSFKTTRPNLIACRGNPQFVKNENKTSFPSKDLQTIEDVYLLTVDCISTEPYLRIDSLFNESRNMLSGIDKWCEVADKIGKTLLSYDWIQEAIKSSSAKKTQQQNKHKSEVNAATQNANAELYTDKQNMNQNLLKHEIVYIDPSKRDTRDEINIQCILREMNVLDLLPHNNFPYKFMVMRTNNKGIDFLCEVFDKPTIGSPSTHYYEVEDRLGNFKDHSTNDVDGILCDTKDRDNLRASNGSFPITQDPCHSYLHYADAGSKKVPIFVLSEYLKSEEFQEIVNKKQKK